MPSAYQVAPLNEVDLWGTQAAFETDRGTFLPPTFRSPYDLKVVGKRAPQEINASTGSYDRATVFSRQGQVVTATAGGNQQSGAMAFEDIPFLNRMDLGGALQTTPTSDGGSPPAYDWTGRPSKTANDQGSLSVETGYPDDVERAAMLMVNQSTIAIDADANASWVYSADLIGQYLVDKPRITGTATGGSVTTVVDSTAMWTVNQHVGAIVQIPTGTGALQERRVLSNTATTLTTETPFTTAPAAGSTYRILPGFTPGIADTLRELIPARGTRTFLDPQSGTLGTTEITERVISHSVTAQNNLTAKTFLENVNGSSSRVGKGRRLVTGQIVLEDDRERPGDLLTEYQRYRDNQPLSVSWRRLRIEQTGSDIRTGVPKRARIDIARLHYTDVTQGDRNGNATITLAWQGYVDPSALSVIERTAKNTIATV